MSRQSWRLVIGFSWCVSMLSACSPTSISSRCIGWAPPSATAKIKAPSPGGEEESSPPPTVARVSPYPQIIPPPLSEVKENARFDFTAPLPSIDPTRQAARPSPGPSTPEKQLVIGPSPTPSFPHEVRQEVESALVTAMNLMLKGKPEEALHSLDSCRGYSKQTKECLQMLLPLLEMVDKGVEN